MNTKSIKFLLACSLCCCAAAALTACGDDPLKGHIPGDERLAIVSNQLLFTAEGSTQTVAVSTDQPLTASLNADWCSAAVEGTTVSVTVQPNIAYDGRTALLTLKAGSASRQLPVQQQGAVFGTLPASDHYMPSEGGSFVSTVRHSLPMTVTSCSDWISVSLDGERLTVTTTSNDDGHLRRGFIVSECADVRDTMNFVQFDLAADVLGSYYLVGNNGGPTGPYSAARFDLIEREGKIVMHWANQAQWDDAYIPVRLDYATCTLTFPSNMQLSSSASGSDVGYFYDSNGRVATSSDIGASARLDYVESTGYRTATLKAANWAGHQLGGFVVRVNRGGLIQTTLFQMANLVITRVGTEGTLIDN